MYQVQRDVKCSKCGKINMIEFIESGYGIAFGNHERYVRCTSCGHEKLVSTTTKNANTTEPITYNAPPFSEPDIF